MREDKPYANYCYDPKLEKTQTSPQGDKNRDLSILDIEYDPPGRDENAEYISIENKGKEKVNMTAIEVLVNKKRLVLSGTIEP